MEEEKFEAVIGLEVHAQISTKSKMFCSCSADAFNKEPNINTCPVCMGFPGQLPVINSEALRKGLIAGLALHCTIPEKSKFDRKNYFYPDLPKGFQISQYDQPIAEKGWLEIEIEGEKKIVNITRLHLEDDAGKLMHVTGGTLCDYNRSGIPLMEIVSEPDLRTSAEAGAYARALQTILRYCGSSDADMEKGMMRFDASVSIRPKGDSKLYARAEIKNLNSFRSLQAAIDYEIERQVFLWEGGDSQKTDVTVGWSDDHQKTYFLREKEGADDYRYFPEPDLPELVLEKKFIAELKNEVPEMAAEKCKKYADELKLSEAEAKLISESPDLARYFDAACKECKDPRKLASLMLTTLLGFLKRDGISITEQKISAENLAQLVNMVNEGKVSMNLAKSTVLEEMYASGEKAEKIVSEKGLGVVSDISSIEEMCRKVIAANEKSAEDYRKGKTNALGFIVGQVMKETKGQADAKMVNATVEKILKNQ